MKNIDINLSSVKNKFSFLSLGTVLTLVFLFLVIVLVYSVYTKLYLSIFGRTELITPANIVRVDLQNYQQTIELINRLEAFTPESPQPRNTTPFN